MNRPVIQVFVEDGSVVVPTRFSEVLQREGISLTVGPLSGENVPPLSAVIFNTDAAINPERISCLEQVVYNDSILVGSWLIDACLDLADSNDGINLRSLINAARLNFSSIIITTTGFTDLFIRYLKLIADSLGVLSEKAFTQNITLLLVRIAGSAKHSAAIDMSIPCVTSQWIEVCFRNGKPVGYDTFGVPAFLGMTVSVSQLSLPTREKIKSLITSNGGQYSADLSFKCSHLVALKPEGDKYQFAKKWKVRVVSESWIGAMLDRHGCVDAEQFLISSSSSGRLTASNSISDSVETRPNRSIDADILDQDLIFNPDCDDYLCGCIVVVTGFTNDAIQSQLLKILHFAGAARLDQMRPFVTHVIVPHANANAIATYHCRSVNAQWLLDCYRAKACVPVGDSHRPKHIGTAPVRTSSSCMNRVPLSDLTECISSTAASRPIPAASPTNFSSFNRSLDRNSSEVGPDAKVLPHLLFSGKNFSLDHPSMDNTERDEARHDIVSHGGAIKEAGDSSGAYLHFIIARHYTSDGTQPDLLFCDIERLWADPMRKQPIMITAEWIRYCIDAGTLVSPCSDIGFLPMPKNPKIKAFHGRGIAVSLSQYVGKQRDNIGAVVKKFGGRCREVLSKRHTHLICAYLDPVNNRKQVMAKEWTIPIVHLSWLYDSVVTGMPLPPGHYEEALATGTAPHPPGDNGSARARTSDFEQVFSSHLQEALRPDPESRRGQKRIRTRH